MIQATSHPGNRHRRQPPHPKGRQVDDAALEEVRGLLGAGERRRDLLIEYLHQIQDRFGHIQARHLAALAADLRLAQAEVYEVATFYAHFDVVKEGEQAPAPLTVRVCGGIACELAGGGDLHDSLADALDGNARIVRAPCLGACHQAPVAVVGRRRIVGADNGHLQPVYGITLDKHLTEAKVPTLGGYRGMGPVRKGNQAYEHIQNDVYGSVILAATQAFFDERLTRPGDPRLFERLEAVGGRCLDLYDKPDAGLWELRTKSRVHTYSSAMCWAGADRLAKIADRLDMPSRAAYWRDNANEMREVILKKAFDAKQNSFVESFNGTEVDCSLLLLYELGFIEATDQRFVGTVEAIEQRLKQGKHLFRYLLEDDFGKPKPAFNICTFWFIDALAATGRGTEARDLFENMLNCRNHLGLLSEDMNPETGELWGNIPQTYSMVGLINSAMLLSKKWREAF